MLLGCLEVKTTLPEIHEGLPENEMEAVNASKADRHSLLFKNVENSTFGSEDSGKNLKLLFVIRSKDHFF